MEKYTHKEMSHISHTLGIAFFNGIMSHLKKDKILPDKFYRNHFSSGHDEVYEGLVKNGFATKRDIFESNCYHVSELGIKKFRKEFAELANYKPVAERGLSYLKNRINFYCDHYNYRFCADNSDHIINAYINEFLKGSTMSKTTTDCIDYFKNELKIVA